MSKKPKQSKQKKKVTTSSSQADTVVDLVGQHILRGHYAEAVVNCEHLLNYLPRHAPLCVDALAQLEVTWGMLQDFSQSFYRKHLRSIPIMPTSGITVARRAASCYALARALRNIGRAIECVRAIQASHLPLLSGFMTWLKQSGLSEETVYNHVVNSDFFTTYLVRDEPLKKCDETRSGDVWMFFVDWFPQKALWASVTSTKSYIASFKKFFQWMGEMGRVSPETVADVLRAYSETYPKRL